MDPPGPPAAVVVDEWPLVRLGIAQALLSVDIGVLADVSKGEEAVRLVKAGSAAYLLLGSFRDLSLPETAQRARALRSPPKLVVLADHIARHDLVALRAAGVDALLPRAVGPSELTDALTRVAAGERVVAPALMSLLVGAFSPAAPGDDEAGSGARPDPDALTRKELEVLARLAEGRSNREIAEALFISPATVKSHLSHIYVKLRVAGRQEAMAQAVALGLLS